MNNSITAEFVAEAINKLISEYNFPIPILQDVNTRLNDSDDPHYHAQQLRYLTKLVEAGKVKKKG